MFLFFARCQYWADLPHHRHQTEFPIQTQNPLALGEYSRTVLKILKQWHEDSFIDQIDYHLNATDHMITPAQLVYSVAVTGLSDPKEKNSPSPKDILTATLTMNWQSQMLYLSEYLWIYSCCATYGKRTRGNSGSIGRELEREHPAAFDPLALAEKHQGKAFRQQYCQTGCEIAIKQPCGGHCQLEIRYENTVGNTYRLEYDFYSNQIKEQINETVSHESQ